MNVAKYDQSGSSTARSFCRFSLICWVVGLVSLLLIRSNINFVLNLFTGTIGRLSLEVISVLVVFTLLAAIVLGPIGLVIAIINRKTYGRKRWIIIGAIEAVASIAVISIFLIDHLKEPPCSESHPEYPYCYFDENGGFKQ